MNRQIMNVVTTLLITAFAGFGLTASAQDPSCCPQPVACAQPVCPQPVACVQQVTCTVACGDPCMDMEALVKRIEKGADEFRKDFNDSLSSDCLGCVSFDADSYKDQVKAFEKATDRLRKDYGDECDVSGQVQEVLSLANCISAYIDPCTLCPEAVAEWNALRADLETLAAQYCMVATFQQPVSLQPQPVCAQPVCVQQVVAPQPVCCPTH